MSVRFTNNDFEEVLEFLSDFLSAGTEVVKEFGEGAIKSISNYDGKENTMIDSFCEAMKIATVITKAKTMILCLQEIGSSNSKVN